MNEFEAFAKANKLLILERQLTQTIHNAVKDIQSHCSDWNEEEINEHINKMYNQLIYNIQCDKKFFKISNKTS